MKLLVKSNSNDSNRTTATGETSYEIPNGTVTIGAIILFVIQTAAQILTNHFAKAPEREERRISAEAAEKSFQLKLMRIALINDSASDRSNSLNLLIGAKLLNDPNGAIAKLAHDNSKIPSWRSQQIEEVFATNSEIKSSDQTKRQQPNKIDTPRKSK